jgi:transposase-like protein
MESTPKPAAKPRRRSFPAAERLRLLAEYDQATPPERAALMRREGLYASIISKWRNRDSEKHSLKKPERGRPAQAEEARENAKLREEVKRLTERATKAESLVQTLGKVSALLQHAVSESVLENQPFKKPLS